MWRPACQSLRGATLTLARLLHLLAENAGIEPPEDWVDPVADTVSDEPSVESAAEPAQPWMAEMKRRIVGQPVCAASEFPAMVPPSA
jgi:hypothetical protein